MEATPTIRYEQRGATAWITLDRPDAMNALSGPMCTELLEVIGRIERDPGIRVIVLTGAGRAFCAGADLKGVFEDAGGSPGPIDPMTDFLDQVGTMMERLRVCPKPSIAALNGLTLAGGLELAMACDLIIAADSARIGDAHANFGVFPGAGGAAILVDPFEVDDIARGIDEALSRRDELSIWGLRQAARRHWSETARLTASAYREVMR